MTLGAPLPFNDDFETDSGVWTFDGGWGRIIEGGLGGSTGLGDSAGDFASNVDTWAVTGVDFPKPPAHPDLQRPLRFRRTLGALRNFFGCRRPLDDDLQRHGTQTEWMNRRFDLSPWREQDQV